MNREGAQSKIDGLVVARMIREFQEEFRHTYPRAVHTSSLCAVGPLQSMIGLAIANGHLDTRAAPATAEPVATEAVAWIDPRALKTLVTAAPDEYLGAVVTSSKGVLSDDLPLYAAPPATAATEAVNLARQVKTDLAAAHAEICKLQGLDPATNSWPEWSSPAHTIAWCDRILNATTTPPAPAATGLGTERSPRRFNTIGEAVATLDGEEQEGDALLLKFMFNLHANVPEVKRPASRSDFSDEQWKRAKTAFGNLRAALPDGGWQAGVEAAAKWHDEQARRLYAEEGRNRGFAASSARASKQRNEMDAAAIRALTPPSAASQKDGPKNA